MALGQLPPPANQITKQRRKEKTVFEKTSSGCERGGAGDSTDATMQAWREMLYRSMLEMRQGRAFSLVCNPQQWQFHQ